MRTVRVGLLMMVVVGAGLIPTAGVSAETRPSAPTVSADGAVESLSDFDGDGLKDLAVGVPDEDVGSVPDAGGVQIIYASANGLTAAGNQFWTQDSPGIVGEADPEDLFGAPWRWPISTATASAISPSAYQARMRLSFRRRWGTCPLRVAQWADVAGSQFWNQNSAGIIGEAEDNDRFGDSLAAANFGKSFRADLSCWCAQGESRAVGLSKWWGARPLRFGERTDRHG